MGMLVMYLDSLFYSEQLLCIKYINPDYGLKYINFTGSGQLLDSRTGGGWIHVRGVRGGWWNNGQCIRVSCNVLIKFDVQNILI